MKCRHTCHHRTDAFTLVELLVVVAIIGLLLSIMLPAIHKSREAAKQLVCAANQKTCTLALRMYSDDNQAVLPAPIGTNPDGSRFLTQALSSNRFRVVGWNNRINYDLGELLHIYMGGSMQAWMCPSLDNVPIDDPANTRGIAYGPFCYFAGDIDSESVGHPDFGLHSQLPQRIDDALPTLPLMQDRLSDRSVWNGAWAANHVRHGWKAAPLAYNPSNPQLYCDSKDEVLGANIARYDGSVGWSSIGQLTAIGEDEWIGNMVYSTLP